MMNENREVVEDGEHVSTFVKLTADELTAYEALGIGSKE